MKKPSPRERRQQSPRKLTKRVKAEEARKFVSEHYTRQVHDDVRKEFTPKYLRGTETREEILLNGRTVFVKVQKRLGPHPGVDTAEVLRRIIQGEPTRADMARIAGRDRSAVKVEKRGGKWTVSIDRGDVSSIVNPSDRELYDLFSNAKRQALEGLDDNDNPEPFFDALSRLGPGLLRDPGLNAVVEGWWLEMLDPSVPREQRDAAKIKLGKVSKSLLEKGGGRDEELTEKERKDIAAACERWLPVHRKLKDVFSPLWDNPGYWSWGLEKREDAIDRLIKKHSIPVSVKEVQDIEKSSLWKNTPWDMTMKRVSAESERSKATVEKIYREHLKENPDHRTKKRKKLTTPIVDERTP